MSGLRGALRDLAHAAGLLGLRHRRRNRHTLTVAMFHRVVEPGTAAARTADPTYTVAAPLFAACLAFFRRHYAVIDLAALRASLAGGAPLPPRALLITFDDGWADNAAVALPLLRRAGLPAVLFAATDAVADAEPFWWQEVMLRALRTGRTDAATLWRDLAPAEAAALPVTGADLALLVRGAAVEAPFRTRLLAPFAAGMAAEGRHMLTPEALRALPAAGMAVAAHGAAHLPLTLCPSPAADLARARDGLAALLGPGADAPPALSFPHGRYDAAVLRAAAATGFDLLFTSDACLNAAPEGRPASLLGRISIEAGEIVGADGRLAPARLAAWLFHRPIRRLAPDA
jgi:peptidoglycan/xylan/chitin deacetylase (PgdA/CDA1 family)